MMKRFCFLLVLNCLIFGNSFGQKFPNVSDLTVDQIMQGEKFVGYLPENIFWSEDSQWIYFSWNPEMDTLRSWYKVSVEGGDPLKMSWEEYDQLPQSGDYNEEESRMVFSENGDLFILNLRDNSRFQITNTVERESNPKFSKGDKGVIYSKGNNLYKFSDDGGIVQLTNFNKGQKKGKGGKAEHEEWLENDQLSWFEILRERDQKDKIREKRREELKPKRPTAFYYGDQLISNIQIDPLEKYVSFNLTKRSSAKGTDVPNFVTESGHVVNLSSRSKVGSPQDSYKMGVYNIEQDTTYLIDPKNIEGIYDKPAFLKDYHEGEEPYENKYEAPRSVIYHGPYFSEDGKAVIVIRSMDNKDRWIYHLNLENGDLDLLDRQHDDAWIGGPGVSGWNFSGGTIGWLSDNKTIYFQSEETGFSHLYTINVETKEKIQLTQGDFEILSTQLSKSGDHFYITSNKESPHDHHFYKMPIAGGEMVRLTEGAGNHNVIMSPNEKYLAIRYSFSNKPWELYLMPNEKGATKKQITNSITKDFQAYQWREPQIVRFKARDGVEVPARLYRPNAGNKNGAAIIFVHGAGYLQNVHHWWSSYYREFMFHNLLADNGYTVLDIDYRASNGYGRDWRTAIYRHMGGQDLEDQIDGAQFLVDSEGIDEDRIGIYGGSYGGFITLMALFTSPGTFKSGAALRSVTDWAHYNHPYTSNILNTPAEDSLAYYKSSPIYHAEGLEDQLLILHGMIDTNVQFQDVVRLAQRLIELKKENWEFAVFPLEGHGFVEPSSWSDEYRRIFKLFQETLRE